MGFHVGVEVDNRVAKTLRQEYEDLENWYDDGCVRSSNGFRRPFFWWEGVVSNEQLEIGVLHLLGNGPFTLQQKICVSIK